MLRLFILLTISLFLVSPCFAAVTHDASAVGNINASTTGTLSFTVGNNANKILLVGVVIEDAAPVTTVSGIVFNTTEAFTKIDAQTFNTDGDNVELWYLLNPTATTANIVVTTAATTAGHFGAISLYNAAQKAPSPSAKASGTVDPATASVTTTVADSWLVDVVGGNTVGTDMTAAVGQTERWEGATYSCRSNGSTADAGVAGAGKATSWTFTDMNWGLILTTVEPYVASTRRVLICD
jgi:hypothetical protein